MKVADNACSNYLLVGDAVTHPWRYIDAEAGQVVTTGTCLPPMAIGAGSRIEGGFGVRTRSFPLSQM